MEQHARTDRDDESVRVQASAEDTEDNDKLDPDEVVTGCFDFRTRTSSFDLHQLRGGGLKKKFSNLFHSASDGSIKPTVSAPATPAKGQSPRISPQQRRRRLVRVVRDVDPEVYGGNNPHVIHRYSASFMQSKQQMLRQRSLSESEYPGERPLPYEVTGHTILKKHSLEHSSSVGNDSASGDCETVQGANKHASFRDEVVVIEFDRKCKVVESSGHDVTRKTRLHDFDDLDSNAACQQFEAFAIRETIAALSVAVSATEVGSGQ